VKVHLETNYFLFATENKNGHL